MAGAHARGITQLPLGEWCGDLSQDLLDTLQGGWLGLIAQLGGRLLDDLESKGGCVCSQGELEAVGAWRGAMLDATSRGGINIISTIRRAYPFGPHNAYLYRWPRASVRVRILCCASKVGLSMSS